MNTLNIIKIHLDLLKLGMDSYKAIFIEAHDKNNSDFRAMRITQQQHINTRDSLLDLQKQFEDSCMKSIQKVTMCPTMDPQFPK